MRGAIFYCRSPTSLLGNPRATLRHHQMALIYVFFTSQNKIHYG